MIKEHKKPKFAVIGLGYVGLLLVSAFKKRKEITYKLMQYSMWASN
jgi:UDP-N-acetyl-D-mannosaminuronate dehydrogenase